MAMERVMKRDENGNLVPEKHLYKKTNKTKHGWTVRYYAVFVDWQKTHRCEALGEDLEMARNKLGELHRLDGAKHDFKAEKQKVIDEAKREVEAAKKGITFKEFGEAYFDNRVPVTLRNGRPKRQRTIDSERLLFNNVLPYIGDLPLGEITKARLIAFAFEWVKVPVTTGRRLDNDAPRCPANEQKFIRYLLNRAEEQGLIAVVPKIKIAKGEHRKGKIKEEKYRELLSYSGREQQRYFICLWETAWRLNEPKRLTWPKVDFKKWVLRLNRDEVKEDYPRVTPISWELMQVLLELKEEQKRVPNVGGYVFTRKDGRPIRSIREAFKAAAEKAGIPDAIPHDIRRSTITRWESKLKIGRQAAMQASGHRPTTVHDKYAELDEDQLVEEFRVTMLPPEKRPQVAQAATQATA